MVTMYHKKQMTDPPKPNLESQIIVILLVENSK